MFARRSYSSPTGFNVPIAVSPANSLRSAAPQICPCGPVCACAYVCGVCKSQAQDAGSSGSPSASGPVARERTICLSASSSANAPDIPMRRDPDLVTAGVAWYRRRCVVVVSGGRSGRVVIQSTGGVGNTPPRVAAVPLAPSGGGAASAPPFQRKTKAHRPPLSPTQRGRLHCRSPLPPEVPLPMAPLTDPPLLRPPTWAFPLRKAHGGSPR